MIALAAGDCTTADTDGSTVSLTTTETTPGSTSSTDDTEPDSPTDADADAEADETAEEDCVDTTALCNEYTVTEPVQLVDVEKYAPTESTAAMEPDGWVVTGLPANFYATATVHEVRGELLGDPADVRFTPVGFTWDYGDGTTRTTTTPGATWAALGQEEFTETPTSHAYVERGAYTVRLVVGYRAEYRFLGEDWAPVAGTLGIPDEPFEVVVGSASTVLVSAECSATSRDDTC